MARRVYVYVGSLLQTFGQKRTGIPRVEWEIARRLIAGGAIPFAFDERTGRFAQLKDGVFEILERILALDLDVMMDAPPSGGGHSLSAAIACAAASAYPHMPRRIGFHWYAERLALHYFSRAFDAMTPDRRRDLARRMDMLPGSALEGKLLERLVRRADGSPMMLWHTAEPIDFEPGAIVVNCGIWWFDAEVAQMRRLKAERDVRYVGVIYDLSPISRPADFDSDAFCRRFRQFLDASLGFADRLLPISGFVARDLEAYAVQSGTKAPKIELLRLAPGIAPGGTAPPSPRLVRAGLRAGSYVPLISTLNPRKGHRHAYEVWRRAVDELGEKVPALVWAGQRGKPDGGALELASADRRLWGRHLHFIEGPSDTDIAWLYNNAAYTIYPSSFEGWGLPISESLAFGKYCLAADNTSLPEAGEGLAFHAATHDTEAWLSEVRRLALEPGYLAAMTARVVAGYRPRNWDDVARDVAASAQAAAA